MHPVLFYIGSFPALKVGGLKAAQVTSLIIAIVSGAWLLLRGGKQPGAQEAKG